MGPLGRAAGIFCGGLLLAGAVWVGRYSTWAAIGAEQARAEQEHEWQERRKTLQLIADDLKEREHGQRRLAEKERIENQRPTIADKPPFPRAVTDGGVFDLGAVQVGEMATHVFKIKNGGEAPLVIYPIIDWHCGSRRRQVVPPGASAEIEVRYTPREAESYFAKSFPVWTNDPERPEIEFKVFAAQQFNIEPECTWHAGYVTDDHDGVATGIVSSANDSDFKITSVDVPDKYVKVQYRPLSVGERRDGLRAGYHFTVTVDRGIPAGYFRREMRIHTTLAGNKTITVDVTARRAGPILFLSPLGNSRAYWQPEKSLINLGRFPHEAGGKVTLPALVYGSKPKFAVTSVDSDADFVNVHVLPDPEISKGEQQGVRFVFEVPAAGRPITRIAPHAVHLNLKTNHPKLREMSFEVEFVSQ